MRAHTRCFRYELACKGFSSVQKGVTCLSTLWQQNDLRCLARDTFVRTNRRAIAMMFVSLSVWDGRALWSYGVR